VAKAAMPVDAEDTARAEVHELATTMSEIDRLISDVFADENVVVAPDKGKELKMPLRKIKILTFGIWVAKNFLKRQIRIERVCYIPRIPAQIHTLRQGRRRDFGMHLRPLRGENHKHFIQECWIPEARNGHQLL
jgi:hypothetical protein